MQHEPIEFGAMKASRATRRATGFKKSSQNRLTTMDETATPVVRDEAFAEYTPAAAGNTVTDRTSSADWRFVTRELIADISAQLETLDRQRRQLARLLESVEYSSISK